MLHDTNETNAKVPSHCSEDFEQNHILVKIKLFELDYKPLRYEVKSSDVSVKVHGVTLLQGNLVLALMQHRPLQ